MANSGFLLDTNVLLALTDDRHQHHATATRWFLEDAEASWSTCAFTQAGFIRLRSSPKLGSHSVPKATEMLRRLTSHAGHTYWPVTFDWMALSTRFGERIFGHQQVTDTYLLGIAVEQGGILATIDRGLLYLAGERYKSNVVVLK